MSYRRTSLSLLVMLCLVLAACAPVAARAPVGDRSQAPLRVPATHTVRSGDTLYSIGWQYGLDVEKLAAWNALQPPYRIYRGQRLRLRPPPRKAPPPRASLPKPSTPRASVPKTASPPAPSRPKTAAPPARAATPSKAKTRKTPAGHAKKTVTASRDRAPAATTRGPLRWRWPASGRLISRFDARRPGRKGIDIAGKTGDPVRAAADGVVVYAGSGLSGYGRLIIIKHNKVFLSAYAHNRKLMAKEGQRVKAGQRIAQMGRSGTDRTRLHFEIRKNGSPVDPLRYLPRR